MASVGVPQIRHGLAAQPSPSPWTVRSPRRAIARSKSDLLHDEVMTLKKEVSELKLASNLDESRKLHIIRELVREEVSARLSSSAHHGAVPPAPGLPLPEALEKTAGPAEWHAMVGGDTET